MKNLFNRFRKTYKVVIIMGKDQHVYEVIRDYASQIRVKDDVMSVYVGSGHRDISFETKTELNTVVAELAGKLEGVDIRRAKDTLFVTKY